MSESNIRKKISFPISLWKEIESFTTQTFIEFPQATLRLLIFRGLKIDNKSIPRIISAQEGSLTKNCSLPDEQWKLVEDFRYINRLPSESDAIRLLVIMGLEYEKSLGMYV